jgi:hypothetical protein
MRTKLTAALLMFSRPQFQTPTIEVSFLSGFKRVARRAVSSKSVGRQAFGRLSFQVCVLGLMIQFATAPIFLRSLKWQTTALQLPC